MIRRESEKVMKKFVASKAFDVDRDTVIDMVRESDRPETAAHSESDYPYPQIFNIPDTWGLRASKAEIRQSGKQPTHSAVHRGYISRKQNSDGTYGCGLRYDGVYGKGYVWISPIWSSTQYVTVTYYVGEKR